MILNHASLASAERLAADAWLTDVAAGVGALVANGVVSKDLRMSRWPHEIGCPGDRSLNDAYCELRQRGERDASAFLMSLSSKAPLLSEVEPAVESRFRGCEETTLPPDDGAPLLLCALTNAVAVSMPSEPAWDHDRLTVTFIELLPDDTFADAAEHIDNLARCVHTGPIIERHREHLRLACSNTTEVWIRRAHLFPHLAFGPDVEDHLAALNPGLLPTLVNRLADLDQTASAWLADGGDAPAWTTRVTPESRSVMNHPKLREARRFRSCNGERLLFEWHARFGSGGRIHLRFEAREREIEIGYVGSHLPL